MEVSTVGRSSTSSVSPTPGKPKLAMHNAKTSYGDLHHHEQYQQQHQHPKDRSLKMFNKVQVVYYLTRNGHLEHPHYMEVSHLATSPLRLKDVTDRLTVLRGKAMPCQYSWSCKRSYKNGYVWNDLTENDIIYAAEGSEYVLKGSEIIHERDLSDIILEDELQIKRSQQRKGNRTKTNKVGTNKSGGTHQGQNYSHVTTRHHEQNDNYDDDEEEEKGSCNSSNAAYPINPSRQIEQEESYSLPSTSSTTSDKQPTTTPAPAPAPAPAQLLSVHTPKTTARIIEEDGDPTVTTSLARNSTVLLHLIACGGGAIVGPEGKGKGKSNGNTGSCSNRNFNFSMKNSLMPCLKQQLSIKGRGSTNNMIPLRVNDEQKPCRNCKAGDDIHNDNQVVSKEEEDEDMMMVRYMSENPRFGNLQSEEKEYFSGTIVEAMSHHHRHTSSSAFAPASAHSHPLVITKSSSYNEQRSSKGALKSEAAASATQLDEDDEKEDAKVKGLFKLCIPQKKNHPSNSAKHT